MTLRIHLLLALILLDRAVKLRYFVSQVLVNPLNPEPLGSRVVIGGRSGQGCHKAVGKALLVPEEAERRARKQ